MDASTLLSLLGFVYTGKFDLGMALSQGQWPLALRPGYPETLHTHVLVLCYVVPCAGAALSAVLTAAAECGLGEVRAVVERDLVQRLQVGSLA
jgi:hypothetical protein